MNGVLLDRLVLEEEYVAVLFLGECLEEEKVIKQFAYITVSIMRRRKQAFTKMFVSSGSLR